MIAASPVTRPRASRINFLATPRARRACLHVNPESIERELLGAGVAVCALRARIFPLGSARRWLLRVNHVDSSARVRIYVYCTAGPSGWRARGSLDGARDLSMTDAAFIRDSTRNNARNFGRSVCRQGRVLYFLNMMMTTPCRFERSYKFLQNHMSYQVELL